MFLFQLYIDTVFGLGDYHKLIAASYTSCAMLIGETGLSRSCSLYTLKCMMSTLLFEMMLTS